MKFTHPNLLLITDFFDLKSTASQKCILTECKVSHEGWGRSRGSKCSDRKLYLVVYDGRSQVLQLARDGRSVFEPLRGLHGGPP